MSTSPLANCKIALVYDQATTAYGGAELVLSQLHRAFPSAPLFTLVHNATTAQWASGWNVHTSGLQRVYNIIHRHEPLSVFAPLAMEFLSEQLRPFDVIISVSAGAAKGVITLPHQLHVCYLLTPTRYLTEQSEPYLQSYPLYKLAAALRLNQPIKRYLHRWDQVAAHRPDRVIAISKVVEQRTLDAYVRHVDGVIYPPIPDQDQPDRLKLPFPKYFVSISRIVWYKRLDIAVRAIAQSPHLPPIILIGTGAFERKLQRLAGAQGYVRTDESVQTSLDQAHEQRARIIFLQNCDDGEKTAILQHSSGLIMPGVEDYGLTAVEAAGHGIGSVISPDSGVAEILTNGKLAVHLDTPSVQGATRAMEKLLAHPLNSKQLQVLARRHSGTQFIKQFSDSLVKLWKQHNQLCEEATKSSFSPAQFSDTIGRVGGTYGTS